ncbi:MAG: NAD+ synthase [Nitrospinae bacterium]|nr:NAD+ synthase [Nitrospinota bacterium]
MKIALAQLNPVIGDFRGNVRKIANACETAARLGAQLVVLPEMAVSGYPPRDLLTIPKFVDENQRALDWLISTVRGPAVLTGHFTRTADGSGKNLANSATIFRDGKILAATRKILLPSYDVFDELRYFTPGEKPLIYALDGVKIGVTICEDIWNMPGFQDASPYARNPVSEITALGADIIVNISASPFRLNRPALRVRLGREIVKSSGLPFILVNQVGGADDILFDGHSFALSPTGEIAAMAKGFEEDLAFVDTSTWKGDIRSTASCEAGELENALVLGVRDYLGKCGFTKAVIGLSGGIDSSVVAVIAVKALGPQNVTGISMPSQYTADASVEDAKKLAENLGMNFHVIPIQPLFSEYGRSLSQLFTGMSEDVTEENIQARIRGGILMAASNKFGSMLLSTGNKSELAVGYCTLYGDMAGGLSVISDVFKTRVYELARWMNRDKEVIPARSITRPPSAELRPDQTDQDSLPPYDALDEIVERYVELREDPESIINERLPRDVVTDVIRKVDANEYKRSQAAMGLKVTDKAFGSGRRMPVAKRITGV